MPSFFKSTKFWVMVGITPTNPHPPPHWDRNPGGRPVLPSLSLRLGSISINFQTLSVYLVRTSSPSSKLSNSSDRVMVDGSPPPYSYSAMVWPFAGGAVHLFLRVTPYSLGLNRHLTTS